MTDKPERTSRVVIRKVKVVEYLCPRCGAWFESRHASRVWCSRKCRQLNYQEKRDVHEKR